MGGERKHVTVLFSDLSGYTAMSDKLDPEEVREISSRIFAQIATTIEKYEGFVEKFIGDAVVAIFGMPAVHEDDPVRAVRAAMDIHRLVHSISPEFKTRINEQLRMHSGIHTGLVVTGEMIVEKGVHGLVGETLNLASRLCDVATPGEILVSAQTHRLISPYFETQPLHQVNLKGIAQPVKPHLVLGELKVKSRFEASQQRGFTDFIGRGRELAGLDACLEKTVAGKGQLVTLTGEAGVGKSRLAYEFRHRIDRMKITVLQGRCQSFGSNIPYLPFIDLLKRGLSLKEDDRPSILEQKAISNILAIDAALEPYLPLYLHVLSIASENFPLPDHLHGEKLKRSISQALAGIVLSNANRKPLVLVFEDWHWADEASDSILKHLASQMEAYPLMLLVLYRPEHAAGWPDWHFHTPCALKAMGSQNTTQIIKSILKVNALPDGFASFIHDRTGGNPFFVEEVCKVLTEDGSVRIADRKISLLRPLEKLKLPATVQAVIRARLDRLDRQVKETLQLGAVIGREFPLSILERISDDTPTLPLSLEVLKSQELIKQVRFDSDAEYMFNHVLTQVTVYKSLLLKKRKACHASVGMALERLYAGRLEEQCEKLSYHYVNSTKTEKALLYLEMAGTKAVRVHSLSEARRYFEKALSMLDAAQLDDGHQQKFIDLSLKWSEISQFVPSNKIRAALIRSLDFAKTFDKQTRIAEVSYWVARFDYMQGDISEAVPQVEQCIKWAKERNDRELLAISYTLFGRICLYTGAFAMGINYLNEGLQLIEPFEKWDDVVYSTAILGLLQGLTGNYKAGMKAIAKAIRIARKHEIPTFEAMAFGYLGSIHYWYGNWRATINNCRECFRISKKLDNALPIIWATFFKGAARFSSGNREEGLTVMEQAIERMKKMDSVLALRFFYSLFAENLALSGNFKQAESANKKAMALAQSGQAWGEISSYRTMGMLAAAARPPDWHQVAADMKNSLDISTAVGAMTERVKGLFLFADLMQKKGDKDRARSYYRQATDLAVHMGRHVR
jgi:class 3 adenylate cyclase/tetratricopeptide (TPR) repeat protein